ncbi:MAG: chloride channel protein, partial [Caulobacterales bacterium]|nr:chloride channel protein [Caulobacterales bacterium]
MTVSRTTLRLLRLARNWAGIWGWALLIGVAVGHATVAFRLTINLVHDIGYGGSEETLLSAARALPPLATLAVPVLGGMVVAGLLWLGEKIKHLPETRALGVADVIEARAVHAGRMRAPPGSGVYSALVSAVSIGSGSSTGREGPAVHLGSLIASRVAVAVRLPAREARTLLACGAAAAVAASFNAPIAGTLFALEVVLGHYATRVIAPTAVAAAAGAVVSRAYVDAAPAFHLPFAEPETLLDVGLALLLGAIAAGAAIAFMRTMLLAGTAVPAAARKLGLPLWGLPPIAGFFVGLIAIAFPEVLGVGYETTTAALAGSYGLLFAVALLLAKFAATTVSVWGRFGGGVFSPAIVVGALLGVSFGTAAEIALGDATGGAPFFAAIGMGAMAGAVLGAPLSTTLIVFELTQNYETTIAVHIAVSLATTITSRVMGGGIFQLQIENHGYVVREGPQRLILQTVRVRDVMTPISRLKKESVMEGASLFVDDTLGKALGYLDAEDLDGAPVKARGGDQPVV